MVSPPVVSISSTSSIPHVIPDDPHVHKDVFEGPEKSLRIHFLPLSNHATLRSLSRSNIDSILTLARCSVLSVVSNAHTDAYLLSESSLFVSDHFLMMKTCGTTALLCALPLILELAAMADCVVTHVQFSRAAYLFPNKQHFPHNSFENEVRHLNNTLHTQGVVISPTDPACHPQWYFYSATLLSSDQKSSMSSLDSSLDSQDSFLCSEMRSIHQVVDSPLTDSISNPANSSSVSLEICMFDLDPTIMRAFHFDPDSQLTGPDDIVTGTTASTGIRSLLAPCDVIDAFNFDPCGYSVNALAAGGGYMTIHITPEKGASYVSFETTVVDTSPAALVARVVRVFGPRRFTVSSVSQASRVCTNKDPYLKWDVLCKLLKGSFEMVRAKRDFDDNGVSTRGCVASFLSVDGTDWGYLSPSCSVITSTDISSDGSVNGEENGCKNNLNDCHSQDGVMIGSGAEVCTNDLNNSLVACGYRDSSHSLCLDDTVPPTILLDLDRVARNFAAARILAPSKRLTLRYPVRYNDNVGLLTVLADLDVTFEATGRSEIEALEKVGVLRERIVLALPSLSPNSTELFDRAGRVVIAAGALPGKKVCKALRAMDVGVEVRVHEDDIDRAAVLLRQAALSCGELCAVRLGIGPESLVHEHSKQTDVMNGLVRALRKSTDEAGMCEVDEIIVGRMLMDNVDVATNRLVRTVTAGGHVTADAGRMLLRGVVGVMLTVIGRRIRVDEAGCESLHYFLDDGIYGVLSALSLTSKPKHGSGLMLEPRVMYSGVRGEKITVERRTTLWGPTCDSFDCIWEGMLVEMQVGDRVMFDDLGVFAPGAATNFNGFANKYDVRYERCAGN